MENETRRRAARRGRPYWEAQIESWRQSGLSQAEYCRREGIAAQQLANWKSRLAEKREVGGFVEIPHAAPAERERRTETLLEIRLEDDLRLSLAVRLPGMLRGMFGGDA